MKLTLREAHDKTGIKINELHRMCRLGELSSTKLHGRIYVDYREIKRCVGLKKPNHVYLIKIVHRKFYKIGVAKNVARRFNSISACNPHELELLVCQECTNALEVEKAVKDRYKKYNVKYEWFNFSVPQAERVERFIKKKAIREK